MFLFPWLDWGDDISDFEKIDFLGHDSVQLKSAPPRIYGPKSAHFKSAPPRIYGVQNRLKTQIRPTRIYEPLRISKGAP